MLKPLATFGSFASSSASARLHHAARSRLGSSGSSDREGALSRGRDLPGGLLRGDFLSHEERRMNSALLLKASIFRTQSMPSSCRFSRGSKTGCMVINLGLVPFHRCLNRLVPSPPIRGAFTEGWLRAPSPCPGQRIPRGCWEPLRGFGSGARPSPGSPASKRRSRLRPRS